MRGSMCTVTFMPRATGYCLAMNRDEKLVRAKGLPPAERNVRGSKVLAPSEPGGGTWIALNDDGVCLALINWYSVAARVKRHPVSRGRCIPAVSTANEPARVNAGLVRLPLKRINPFRLIGVFPRLRQITEWRWNLKQLVWRNHRWRSRQWISSGFDEPTAQQVRGRTFRQAKAQASEGTLDWLRRLHRSHSPQRGPFSTCMHRDDAATVSYTELCVWRDGATMRHILGAPCLCAPGRPFTMEFGH
jgi:hypothetical protein